MNKNTIIFALLATLLIGTLPRIATANDIFPRAASLKRSEVYVRSGPGTRYPILWVFQRKGWPISLLNKYDNWFKIRDVEGEEGWVYVGMVSSEKTAIISPGQPALMTKKASGDSPLLRLSSNVIITLEECPKDFPTCRVKYKDKIGFIAPERVLRPQE